MSRILQIGITGGIGSGKSTVCRIFGTLGVPVYDADSRAKSLMTTDGILITQIKKEFGVLSYHSDGSIDREYLAQAFQDKGKLELLNGLIHPRVATDYHAWVSEQKSDYVLKEAALLFEAKSHRTLDKVIVVSAPEELRIGRVLKRDSHRTRQQVMDIIHNQWSEEERLKLADFVIVNDESSLVTPQVLKLHDIFTSMRLEG